MSNNIIVGISDCKVSADPKAAITTYALGSCVGIAMYDPNTRIGGLLHVLLPHHRKTHAIDENPFMFADTGISSMIEMMKSLGASPKNLQAKLAGGANMLNSSPVLDVGKRNSQASLDTLGNFKVPVLAQCLGGSLGRGMNMALKDGNVIVRHLGGEEITI